MNKQELLKKDESGEGLTASEVKAIQKLDKPVKHTYGKYGNLAKIYLEEHNVAKFWALGGDLPEYLHGVDKAASELYEAMYEKLSASERYKKNGEFMHDLHIETEIKQLIEEEILNEIVYV
jgi:hypothetical protein